MTSLRWEKQQTTTESWWAYSGKLVVGAIQRSEHGDYEYCVITGIHDDHTSRKCGFNVSLDAAKVSLERAWATWLEEAGLVPAERCEGQELEFAPREY